MQVNSRARSTVLICGGAQGAVLRGFKLGQEGAGAKGCPRN